MLLMDLQGQVIAMWVFFLVYCIACFLYVPYFIDFILNMASRFIFGIPLLISQIQFKLSIIFSN